MSSNECPNATPRSLRMFSLPLLGIWLWLSLLRGWSLWLGSLSASRLFHHRLTLPFGVPLRFELFSLLCCLRLSRRFLLHHRLALSFGVSLRFELLSLRGFSLSALDANALSLVLLLKSFRWLLLRRLLLLAHLLLLHPALLLHLLPLRLTSLLLRGALLLVLSSALLLHLLLLR